MATRTFMEKLEAKWAEGKYVCVGLDPDYDKMPQYYKEHVVTEGDRHKAIWRHMIDVIATTSSIVAAWKPNSAFYESMGSFGIDLLEELIGYSHQRDPDVPVILDVKRGDIGNTNEHYAKMAFDIMGADAITIHPYLGWEANKPFLDRADKGIFVLCRTSNPGAGEFQDMAVRTGYEGISFTGGPIVDVPGAAPILSELYLQVAEHVSNPKTWNQHGNCGLVTGATYPDEIAQVRRIAPDIPLLIPGMGKQGGDLEASVAAAKHRFLINSSSGIIFADDPRAETLTLDQQIREVMAKLG